jgi:GTP pyrophosphokinase
MHRKSVSFEKLLDIIAFRIITKDLQDCYKVLGFINSNYVMVPDTFKDYISKPKINGYQSLHMVIIGPKNVKMEIQIRTESMDRINEYGVASHWMYKQNIKESGDLKEYNFIKKLVQNIENSDYGAENYEDLKYEFGEDEIFCYTPKGDIINLPLSSTGIDFAYAIHREVGNRTSGVKINGVLSQFKTQLKSGDEVEILTSKSNQVNDEWLNFVKTAKAKSEIKQYIRKTKEKEFEKIGKEDVANINKELKVNITDELIEKNIQNFQSVKSAQEVYRLLAEGKIKKKELLNALFPNFEKEKITDEQILTKIKINNNVNTDKLGIQGLDKNTAYKYAKCCYPIPPEEIVGVVNSGVGITVHKKNCPTLKNIQDERIIDLDWNLNETNKHIAKLSIVMDSVPGVFAKVINACAEKKINIIGVSTTNESELYQEVMLKIEVKNSEELEHFKAYLRRSIKGIIEIS